MCEEAGAFTGELRPPRRSQASPRGKTERHVNNEILVGSLAFWAPAAGKLQHMLALQQI